MRWTPLSFSSYLILNKSPGVAKIKLHWLICLFTNYFLLQFKKKNHTKSKLLNLPRFPDSLQKKKKGLPCGPLLPLRAAACIPLHLSTGFYFPFLGILLVRLSCSLCCEGFILLWVSSLSFSWSQEEQRTTCVVSPPPWTGTPFPYSCSACYLLIWWVPQQAQ